MKHSDKVKLAKKMRTPLEEKSGVPLFLSKAWLKRQDAIIKRVNSKKHEAKIVR